jgi:hypothetical protein
VFSLAEPVSNVVIHRFILLKAEPKREMTYIRSDRACDKLTLWYWAEDPDSKEKYQALVPLTDVAINGTINGSLASLNV